MILNYAIIRKDLFKEYIEYKNINNLSDDEKNILLNEGWKEVEDINEMITPPKYHKVDYTISLIDNKFIGSYILIKKRKEITDEIIRLKEELSSSDYKVNKNLEAQMAGVDYPYNPQELHNERQALRDKINELEELLKQ